MRARLYGVLQPVAWTGIAVLALVGSRARADTHAIESDFPGLVRRGRRALPIVVSGNGALLGRYQKLKGGRGLGGALAERLRALATVGGKAAEPFMPTFHIAAKALQSRHDEGVIRIIERAIAALGDSDALERAQNRVRGYAMKLAAAHLLGPQNLAALSRSVGNVTVDAVGESRGHVVNVKSVESGVFEEDPKALMLQMARQLAPAVGPGRPALAVVGHDANGALANWDWTQLQDLLGTETTVLLVDHETGAFRVVPAKLGNRAGEGPAGPLLHDEYVTLRWPSSRRNKRDQSRPSSEQITNGGFISSSALSQFAEGVAMREYGMNLLPLLERCLVTLKTLPGIEHYVVRAGTRLASGEPLAVPPVPEIASHLRMAVGFLPELKRLNLLTPNCTVFAELNGGSPLGYSHLSGLDDVRRAMAGADSVLSHLRTLDDALDRGVVTPCPRPEQRRFVVVLTPPKDGGAQVWRAVGEELRQRGERIAAYGMGKGDRIVRVDRSDNVPNDEVETALHGRQSMMQPDTRRGDGNPYRDARLRKQWRRRRRSNFEDGF